MSKKRNEKVFYTGLIGLALFEILNVYLIMPMLGSQEIESLDIACFLYGYRWPFRIIFTLLIVDGSIKVLSSGTNGCLPYYWWALGFIVYYINFNGSFLP